MQPQAPTQAPQPATSGQAMQNLQSFQSSMQKPGDVLSQEQQRVGLPGQQQQVSGLRQAITNTTNLLNQVAPSVYGRTQGSLVTTAQAGRQIANEQAPLSQQLQTEGQQYSGAQSDLARAQAEAAQAAGLRLQGQQQELGNLESIYQNLYKQEQDAAARQLQERQLALQSKALSGPDLSSLLGGGAGAQQVSNGISLRVPGDPSKGFGFVDNAGNTVNALQYSQGHQIPFRTLLQQMASKGDTGAKLGLTFIGNDGNADPTKITSQAMADLYHSLTGRYVGINPAVSSLQSVPSFGIQGISTGTPKPGIAGLRF